MTAFPQRSAAGSQRFSKILVSFPHKENKGVLVKRLFLILVLALSVVSGTACASPAGAQEPTIPDQWGKLDGVFFIPEGCSEPCYSLGLRYGIQDEELAALDPICSIDWGNGISIALREGINDYKIPGSYLVTKSCFAYVGLGRIEEKVMVYITIPYVPGSESNLRPTQEP